MASLVKLIALLLVINYGAHIDAMDDVHIPIKQKRNSTEIEEMKNAWIAYELVVTHKVVTHNYKQELLVQYNELRKAFNMPPDTYIDKEWLDGVERVLSHIIDKPYLGYKKKKKRRNKICLVI